MDESRSPSEGALRLILFGPMGTLVHGQTLPPLRSRKALWLLALLALRHGRPVEREWLAGTLWPDASQSQAYANLRTVLSELRKALGPEGGRLHSPDRHTVRLDLTGADVDLLDFDEAVESSSPSAWEKATALYRGPLLEGCSEEWVHQERSARERACFRAFRRLADSALATGDYETAADRYRSAIAIDSWSDVARRGLMRAFAKSGNLTEALLAYRAFEELLIREAGGTPDEKTTTLYRELRNRAREAARATTKATSAPTATSNLKIKMPQQLTPLVGRDDEREDVATLLRRSRLLTLAGLGGIGKTRLAIAVACDVAGEYPDGAWFVTLESIAEDSQVTGQISSALEIPDATGRPLLDFVTEHLRKRRLLLVLDNCEHVLQATAAVARHLLRECPGLRVLTTSREPLGITGESVWKVPALAVPVPEHLPTGASTLLRVLSGYEGVTLFLERSRAVRQSFSLTPANALDVAKICARLEGIPLALELAAARSRSMTVEEILRHLVDRLGSPSSLLGGADTTILFRQRTLRGTLEWSYTLLDEPARVLFGRLSVFSGGWTLQAAREICNGDGLEIDQVRELLTSLVDKSLVVFEDPGSDGAGRYRMLEIVRQYAFEVARERGDANRTRSRHLDWFAALAAEAAPRLRSVDQQSWMRKLDADRENMRRALDEADLDPASAERALRLAGALTWYWYVRGEFTEGRRFLRRALERSDPRSETSDRARALNGAATLAHRQRDIATAGTLYEESLRIFKGLGLVGWTAASVVNLGNVLASIGDEHGAREMLEQGIALHREIGNTHEIAVALGNLGCLEQKRDDFAKASQLFSESLVLFRELGDRHMIAWSLTSVGDVAQALGDYPAAHGHFEEALQLTRELGDRRGVALSLKSLGDLALLHGELESAEQHYGLCRTTFTELGDRYCMSWTLVSLGDVAWHRRDSALAESLYQQGLHLARETGDARCAGVALRSLGVLAQERDALEDARRLFGESLELLTQHGGRIDLAAGIHSCAALILKGQPRESVRLMAAAEKLRESTGTVLPPREQARHQRQVAVARAALGDLDFSGAWEEGSAMSPERAIECAREDLAVDT